MTITCSNCKTDLSDDAKYCSHCGQSTKSFRQPFVPFVKESLHELLDIDGRLSRTLKVLVSKPGLASYEFDQGMRAKYTPALRLYLVISVIFFLVFSSFHQAFTGTDSFSNSTIDLYSKAMFALFPLFAVYVKLLFQESYFVTNLVFSLHIHSVGYLVLMLIAPLERLESVHQIFMFLQIPPALYFLWYFITAFKTMYRQSWPRTLLKSALMYLIYMGTLGIMFDVVLAS